MLAQRKMKARHFFPLLLVVGLVGSACHKRQPQPVGTYDYWTGRPIATAGGTDTGPAQDTQTAPPPTSTAPPPVYTSGPPSDADRAAARDLFNAGASFQQQNKHGEALDSFSRSMSVYPAPTTALRIAQCKAALGRLIEASEGYRAIVNAQLPAGSPPAYVESQKAAAEELARLEPKIPKARIIVVPDRAPGLAVAIDGRAMNPALVGVSRPVDPGRHRISAVASGFAATELTFEVRETEQKDVQVVLRQR
ncbi:hypothetical protein BH09MYX1_BH09MYX1_51100 [soil metagenome]